MKEQTRKTILIIFISIMIAGAVLSFLGSAALNFLDKMLDSSETESALEELEQNYGDIFSKEELERVANSSSTTLTKISVMRIFVGVILLLLAINGPSKNRRGLICIGIFDLIISFPSIMALLVLIFSCIKSSDITYEKQKLPEPEAVNTFKLPVYVISFLFIFLFFYVGLDNLIVEKLHLEEFFLGKELITNVIFFSLLALMIVILLRKELARDWKLFIHNLAEYVDTTFLFYIILLGSNLLIGLILRIFVKDTSDNQAALNDLPKWFMIIFGAFIGPFVEEGVFRGLLGKIIKNKPLFVIVSSVLFGAMHVLSIGSMPTNNLQYLYLIQYIDLGVIITLNYVKTKNLWASTMVHSFMNLFSVVLTFALL